MNRLNLDIVGVCQTKWAIKGDFVSNRHRVISPAGEKNERSNTIQKHEEMSSDVMSTL